MHESEFPLFFYLTSDGIRNLIRTYPETMEVFEAFNNDLMSWNSALTVIIELLMQRLKVQSQPKTPIMN
jgi:hypothetical protein